MQNAAGFVGYASVDMLGSCYKSVQKLLNRTCAEEGFEAQKAAGSPGQVSFPSKPGIENLGWFRIQGSGST